MRHLVSYSQLVSYLAADSLAVDIQSLSLAA